MDEELQLLTVHGVLHLLGYDHEEPDEKAEMFGLQAAIVDGWRAEKGLTGPSPAPSVSWVPDSSSARSLWSSSRGCSPAPRPASRGSPPSVPRKPSARTGGAVP